MATQAKTSNADKEKQRILTPVFRVSYPHVFKPSAFKGAKPKYSVTMLFPKNGDLTSIKEAIKQAKIAAYGPKKSEWPEHLESPVTDGDDPKHANKEGYKGHWAIKASSNEDQKPGVVDKKTDDILDPSEFYPGCYARAYVFAYAWEFAGKQGVSFILDHVQKVKDGKSFGGKKSAKQVFTALEDDDNDDNDDDSEDFM